MFKLPRFPQALVIASMAFVTLAQAVEPPSRPRVGLVLGGGGARGAAHIGVLEVLEEMRVPVDCVAGTSMGALIAGAYASGLSPAQMRQEMAKADWKDMFVDTPDLSDVAYRNKQFLRRFIPSSETGVTPDGVKYPPGAVDGEKIKLFFNHLVGSGRTERLIERLPLKVSLIATDIGTGERVVMREGSLTTAMRASMSVPGLLSPVAYDGRKLVDGGLVDNVPIGEVRERCNPDVVIAINVGSPMLKSEDVGSLLSVSAQMVNLLTEQNVTRSLATLKPTDIYIRPELGDITAGDFARNAETADLGKAAANAVRGQFDKLSVTPERYADWRVGIDRATRVTQKIDQIEVVGLNRVNPAMVERQLRVRPGDPVDVAKIEDDVLRINGDGMYQSVDYKLLNEREKNILRILPVEKYWGPDYMRFAMNLDADSSQGSGFSVRGAYHNTLINSYGAESLVGLQFGNTNRVFAEFYQPLDPARHFFLETQASYTSGPQNVYFEDKRVAQYARSETQIKLGVGANLGLAGQAGIDWVEQKISLDLDVGSPRLPNADVRERGIEARFLLDQMNRLYFASRGWAVGVKYFDSAENNYSRLDLNAAGAFSLGKTVINTRVSHTSSPTGALPFYNSGSLGGVLNMSAFAKGQLVGDNMTYAGLRAEQILGELGLGMRGDLRFGVALEGAHIGKMYSEPTLQSRQIIPSIGAYFASETPIGPAYLGFGYSPGGYTNLFFNLGIP